MLGQEIDAILKCRHPNVIQLINAYINPTEQPSLLYFEYTEKRTTCKLNSHYKTIGNGSWCGLWYVRIREEEGYSL